MKLRTADVLLGAVGRLLWHLHLAPLLRHLRRNTPKILVYHACEPEESVFIRGMGVNCPPHRFAAQLDHLQRHYRVISLDELQRAPPPGAVVITFDDGYRSVLEHAAPLLAERGLPAVAYLITGAMNNEDAVWFNELTWLLNTHPNEVLPIATAAFGLEPNSEAERLIEAAASPYDTTLIHRVLDMAWERIGGGRAEFIDRMDLYLTWDDVRDLLDVGFAFGSHTVTHPDLRRVGPDQLAREIDDSVEAFRRETGDCTSFAYPFGSADEVVMDAVERHDFASVMLVRGGDSTASPRRFARTSLSATTDAQMFAELEVIEPFKASVRSSAKKLRITRQIRRLRSRTYRPIPSPSWRCRSGT